MVLSIGFIWFRKSFGQNPRRGEVPEGADLRPMAAPIIGGLIGGPKGHNHGALLPSALSLFGFKEKRKIPEEKEKKRRRGKGLHPKGRDS